MDPATIASALVGLFGFLKGSGNQQQASATGLSPEMEAELLKMLGLQTQRAEETAPIHQAAMAMASRLAPKYARDAMTGPPARGGAQPSGPSSPTLNGNSLNTQVGSGSFAPLSSGNPFTEQGIQFVNGQAYRVPGGSNRPVTGPEDPDLLHHPTLSDADRQVSEALQRWFFGNPGNAFFGNGVSGSGQQNGSDGGLWHGRGRAV